MNMFRFRYTQIFDYKPFLKYSPLGAPDAYQNHIKQFKVMIEFRK